MLIFLLSASARNAVKKAFMSDESYFKSVETNFVEDLVDDLALAYEDDLVSFFDFYKSEYEFNAAVSVKDEAEDFLEDIYKQNRDLDLSWIKSANVSGNFAIKDKNLEVKAESAVNKKDFLDFDIAIGIAAMHLDIRTGILPVLDRLHIVAAVLVDDPHEISEKEFLDEYELVLPRLGVHFDVVQLDGRKSCISIFQILVIRVSILLFFSHGCNDLKDTPFQR